MYPLNNIDWMEWDQKGVNLSQTKQTVLPAGLEADVLKITGDRDEYVLKIWCRDSKPDVAFQYHMLRALRNAGISVSQALGWGLDGNRHQVLLTSYDGVPLAREEEIGPAAKLLAGLHKLPIDIIPDRLRRRCDFITYFFPRLPEHPDLQEALLCQLDAARMTDDAVIHGDYNLGNVLVARNRLTIIDWTNAQVGDRRYDLAWAGFLIWVYNGENLHHEFIKTYSQELPPPAQERIRFESIACLRWLHLNRLARLPKKTDTDRRVNEFIINHSLLPSRLTISEESSEGMSR